MADIFPMRVIVGGRPTATDQPPLQLAKRPDFHLGAILIRPSRLALEGPSGPVPVERRMMEVLLAFFDAGGAVLTKEDLMARCWPGVVVGDDALHRVIGSLRKAAANAGGGFTIETVPRIGYRLQQHDLPEALPLVERTTNLVYGQPATTQPLATPDRPVTRRWLIAGGASALSVGGVLFWAYRRPPLDPEAARLMGEALVALRLGTPKADAQAIALLERAATSAPDNASTWGLLALARARADEHGSTDKGVSPAAQIDTDANRALALDGSNADAKAALAIAIPYYGDWLTAERRFDAVLVQHSSHIVTKDSRAFLLNAVGRMREGAEARLAFSGDASFDAGMQFRQIYALWFLNRIEEADRVASRGMQMWPHHYGIWLGRLWLLAGTGRLDRALAHIDDQAARPPLSPPMIATLRAGVSASMTRQPVEIDAAIERVMAGVGLSVGAVVNAMMLLNLMGATDAAFDLANAYYLEQGPVIAAMQWRPGQPIVPDQRRRKTNMLFTPVAAAMRRDPRFPQLVEAMGLTNYWRRRGIRPDYLLRA